MRSNVKPCTRLMPTASFLAAAVIAGVPTAHGATIYTVTNISTAVTAAGTSTATSDFGSASLSSTGNYIAGLTSAGNPFLYVPSTNTATVLTSITAVTVGVNISGTLVGGNTTAATTPNFVYKNGTTSTVPTSAITNPNTSISGVTPTFLSLTGINDAGIASGYVQYATTNGTVTPGYSGRNEGINYNVQNGTGTDVGSGFSNLNSQPRGNILYSINNNGVSAGHGVPGTTATETGYTATPNGTSYTYNNLSAKLMAFSSTAAVSTAYVGIDSNGDVAGTFNTGTLDGFLYDPVANAAYDISPGTGNSTNINGIAYVNGVAVVIGVNSGRGVADSAIAFTKAGGYQTLVSYIGPAATGYTLTSGLAINGNGDILALGTSPAGVTGEYLFASVPEPTSLAALGLGCLALNRRTRRPTTAAPV